MKKSNLLCFREEKFKKTLTILVIILLSFSCKSSSVGIQGQKKTSQIASKELKTEQTKPIETPSKPAPMTRQEILKANADKIPAVDKPSGIDDNGEPYYDTVESPAIPPGGLTGWTQYLSSNIKYPEMARKNGISGTVIALFIVNKDGSISNVEILRGIGGGCDEETYRVIKNSPNWTAGKLKTGEAVNTRMRLPIRYQ